MTSSDNRMDRELRGQAMLSPPRSVWPEVESHLDLRERRVRWRGRIKVVAPALAASLVAAVALYDVLAPATSDVSAMQNTVENAVRNAMPVAAFSALQVNNRNLVLEALLVSARPRDGARAVHLGVAPLAGESRDGARHEPPQQQKKVDAF